MGALRALRVCRRDDTRRGLQEASGSYKGPNHRIHRPATWGALPLSSEEIHEPPDTEPTKREPGKHLKATLSSPETGAGPQLEVGGQRDASLVGLARWGLRCRWQHQTIRRRAAELPWCRRRSNRCRVSWMSRSAFRRMTLRGLLSMRGHFSGLGLLTCALL